MNDFEKIENEVKRLQLKSQYRIERMKRLKEFDNPKFTEFNYGKVWGSYQAYSTILGIINKLKN